MNNLKKFKLIFVALTFYILIAHLALNNLQINSKENVTRNFKNTTSVVVAHPDDETMFFGPTILNLLESNTSIVILCLSNGNAVGQGSLRELELVKVIESFGPNVNLEMINDSRIQDSETSYWDPTLISRHIETHVEKFSIQTLVTFDFHGVSGHVNHRSVNRALQVFKGNPKYSKIDILVLSSVNRIRKYTSFSDSIFTILSSYIPRKTRSFSLGLDLTGYSSLKRTLKLHESQMVWFRQLYMMFSRYMFINDLEYFE